MLKSKKIAPGLYEVSVEGRIFQIEDAYQARGVDGYPRNDWNLFEIQDNEIGNRDWCQSFSTKRDAILAINGILEGEE